MAALLEIDTDEPSREAAEMADDLPEEDTGSGVVTLQQLAQHWVSYAVGVVFGRFHPGVEQAIGRGTFSAEIAAALVSVVDRYGIRVVDDAYSDNLVACIEHALELMLGQEQADQLITIATGGRPLADYLIGDFFKQHVQLYRQRPVYWLLQSPKRTYSLLVFHERLTRDSLYVILGASYLGGAINAAQTQANELRRALEALPQGRERKRLEGELAVTLTKLNDLEEFRRLITEVTTATNERGEVVGWQPEIDDGVLINLAPLHKLIPAWSAEPKKAWAALERGEYDWSHTAMRYWPDRVLKACENNKSYAIAHGLVKP